MRVTALVALGCCLSTASAYEKRVLDEVLPLSNTCQKLYVNVDQYDKIEIESQRTGHSVPAGTSCEALFRTLQPSHGLCINVVHISSSHAQLEIHTGPSGPERIVRYKGSGDWCFPHRLLAVRVKIVTSVFERHPELTTKFLVTNVTLDSIPRHYYMDSFAECGLTHTLTPGQKVNLEGERDPLVTYDPPTTCELTFEVTSDDEYEQVCLELTLKRNFDQGMKSLEIQGLNTRFYSIDGAFRGETICSSNKQLKLVLTRDQNVPFNFRATVTAQWHPFWESESSEAAELQGLRVVKGITYFIATIDSLIAVLAAGLATLLKRPHGPWRRWAEDFNAQTAAHAPQSYTSQDPANYGSMHACQDGNYPELQLEGATSTNEVFVESHTY